MPLRWALTWDHLQDKDLSFTDEAHGGTLLKLRTTDPSFVAMAVGQLCMPNIPSLSARGKDGDGGEARSCSAALSSSHYCQGFDSWDRGDLFIISVFLKIRWKEVFIN